MFRTRSVFGGMLTAAVASVGLGGQAGADMQFTFEKVLDAQSNDFQSIGPPDINDAGQIAFHADLGAGHQALLTVLPGQSPQFVIGTDEQWQSFDPFPKLSNSGTLTGWGTRLDEQRQEQDAIIVGDADGDVEIVAQTNGNYESLAPGPSISADDTVAYRGESTTEGAGVFTRQLPDPSETIENESGDYGTFFAPFINQAGDTTFFASNPQESVVYNQKADGTRQKIIDNQGDYSGILPYSAPNSHGEVAIRGIRADGTGEDILLSDGDTLEVLASDDAPFHSFQGDLAINDNGNVVFNPRLVDEDDGGPGSLALYFSDQEDLHRVIGPGDDLFGSSVRDVFFVHGLNESDTVAFLYVLENDELGIATTVIPEPGTAGLLVAAAGLALLRRRSLTRLHTPDSVRQ